MGKKSLSQQFIHLEQEVIKTSIEREKQHKATVSILVRGIIASICLNITLTVLLFT